MPLEEKRQTPFCNIYDLHCKEEFIEIKKDIKDIRHAILGNGDNKNSIIVQATLNTNHRKWMETWGRALMSSSVVALFGFVGTLLWVVYSHAK